MVTVDEAPPTADLLGEAGALLTLTRSIADERDKLREALSRLVWEVQHRERPRTTFAFHFAEELVGDHGSCLWPSHGTDILRHWGDTR